MGVNFWNYSMSLPNFPVWLHIKKFATVIRSEFKFWRYSKTITTSNAPTDLNICFIRTTFAKTIDMTATRQTVVTLCRAVSFKDRKVECPSGLSHYIQNRKVPGSNPTRCQAGILDSNSLRGSRWPSGHKYQM